MTLGTGNPRSAEQEISHLLSKVTHTPPKTTGVVTPVRCLRCQSRHVHIKSIINFVQHHRFRVQGHGVIRLIAVRL